MSDPHFVFLHRRVSVAAAAEAADELHLSSWQQGDTRRRSPVSLRRLPVAVVPSANSGSRRGNLVCAGCSNVYACTVKKKKRRRVSLGGLDVNRTNTSGGNRKRNRVRAGISC